jgi:arylsulfatase A-like enzyme
MKFKLALLSALLLAPLCQIFAAETQRPNIVFILADDLRPDALGCTGNVAVKTPHLDRLAARGMLFTRATCGYPICHVSRTEILTGRCLTNADMPKYKVTIDPHWVLWPEAMRRAGWHTAYSGKWHTPGTPQSSGYAETSALFSSGGAKDAPLTFSISSTGGMVTGYKGWTFKDARGDFRDGDTVGLTPETDARIADGAIEVIRRHNGKPFFLHVNFTAPHDPLLWPRGIELPIEATFDLPNNFRAEHPFNHGNLTGRDEMIVPAPRSHDDVKRERAVYFELVQNSRTQSCTRAPRRSG